ncbi:MAG: hypothetical protein QOF91_1308 [Alphaproteobacteria bacterium]|nr:hypothetical protein [Alphaproteobacteria bacterium]
MRRGTMLVFGLLMASTALPQTVEARPMLLKVLQGITAPIGAVLGGPRHAGRRAAHSRRAVASRRAKRAVVAAAPAAAGATAATAAGVTRRGASEPVSQASTQASTEASTPASTQSTQDSTQRSPAVTTGSTVTPDAAIVDLTAQPAAMVPLPAPAPPQRSATLAVPDDIPPQARASAPGQMLPPQAPPPARPQSRLGTVGPLAWPTAYEDVIGFTLWPKEYGERLRIHGIGDVLSTAFAPGAAIAARTEANRARPANLQQARADEPNSAPVTAICGGVDLTAGDWPIAQITSAIELTDAQRGPLDRLKTALSDAVSSIKSSCRDDVNLTPVERLRAMQNTLWAVHDATQLIRAPLARFYDSLTEQQKQKFAAPAQAGGRTLSRSDMARMCDLPVSSDAPIRQIEQSLRPTKDQRASLESLQKKSFEMGQFLMASCLKPMPATPAERLDAAADRLTAVIFAASNVNMELSEFTNQLSDEQKIKLNAMLR